MCGRVQLRGKLIGALGKVSGKLQDPEQVFRTTDVMKSVTSKPDEVKSTDKVGDRDAFYSRTHTIHTHIHTHCAVFDFSSTSL